MSTAQELIDQGVQEGALNLLKALLKEKFRLATLPPDVEERLAEASPRQLQAWGTRVLGAKKLADVFGQTSRPQKRPGSGRKKVSSSPNCPDKNGHD